jgi:hypothetical protein
MKEKLIILCFLIICFSLEAQIENITTKYDLPETLDETSGLLFFNGKLITHNDSGDNANLYELDTVSGNIFRTVNVSNATNIDWEDITQDDTYIYIGDFGNNNGNRQDLKIYRVLKTDYSNNTSVTADIISFSYEDQVDFSTNPYNHDFDAEAFSVYKNELIIFSKNWASSEVKAYSIPKTIGNHSAKNIGSYNSEGLITGAAFNPEDNSFLLCGYSNDGNTFLLYLKDVDIQNPFTGVIERTNITSSVSSFSQTEGIAHIVGNKYFLSRESVNRNINGNQVVLPQHLFRFDNGSFKTLNIEEFNSINLKVYPNPTQEVLFVDGIEIEKMIIVDINGKTILEQKKSSNQIRINKLTAGIYFLKIVSKSNTIITKKFIKN